MNSNASNTIIYAYRLTDDTGCAPCIFDLDHKPTGVLTLACCKGGQICKNGSERRTGLRHTIGKEYKEPIKNGKAIVYLLGIYKNTLLYFARVTEVITMAEYFAPNGKYKHHLDCIYDTLPNGGFRRNDNNPKFHPKDCIKKHSQDWLGEYVLISDIFAYFGKESSAISLKNLSKDLPEKQGHMPYDSNSDDGKQIIDEVSKRWDFQTVIQNRLHDDIRNCHSKGCGKNESKTVRKRLQCC
jgi:hypothetical protein